MTKVKISRPITVDHIARIEGKAGIEVKLADNTVKDVRINIFEGPRFFESITLGKPVEEAVAVFPRVCSFCAAAHKITAVMTAEDAIGMEVTEQTKKLRELLYLGDHIESHALHLFFFAMPDFFGYPDALSMTDEYGDVIKTALALKDVGAMLQTRLGSRHIHQENVLIGGFGKLPTKESLREMAEMLKGLGKESELAFELLLNFEHWPELNRDRTHLALKPPGESYGVLGGSVVASDGEEFGFSAYRDFIKESVVAHSFAKHSHYKEAPFMTSALSRITLFGDRMSGRARELALMHPPNLSPDNPMANNVAQAVELIYFVEKAAELAEELAETLNPEEKRLVPEFGKAGSGFCVTEAPRGLLAYTLEVDEGGKIVGADIITPTAMFLPMLEDDIRRMTQGLLEQGVKDPEAIANKLETVVRAYDPCVSCSVHVTTVRK